MNGVAEIAAMMKGYRDNHPQTINGIAVAQVLDYELQIATNVQTKKTTKITFAKERCAAIYFN